MTDMKIVCKKTLELPWYKKGSTFRKPFVEGVEYAIHRISLTELVLVDESNDSYTVVSNSFLPWIFDAFFREFFKISK